MDEGHFMVGHHSLPLLSFLVPPLLPSFLFHLFSLSSVTYPSLSPSPPPPSMPCIFNSNLFPLFNSHTLLLASPLSYLMLMQDVSEQENNMRENNMYEDTCVLEVAKANT